MPYDPALEEAARMKMFHLLTNKIERDSAGLLDNTCYACFLVALVSKGICNHFQESIELREAQ